MRKNSGRDKSRAKDLAGQCLRPAGLRRAGPASLAGGPGCVGPAAPPDGPRGPCGPEPARQSWPFLLACPAWPAWLAWPSANTVLESRTGGGKLGRLLQVILTTNQMHKKCSSENHGHGWQRLPGVRTDRDLESSESFRGIFDSASKADISLLAIRVVAPRPPIGGVEIKRHLVCIESTTLAEPAEVSAFIAERRLLRLRLANRSNGKHRASTRGGNEKGRESREPACLKTHTSALGQCNHGRTLQPLGAGSPAAAAMSCRKRGTAGKSRRV